MKLIFIIILLFIATQASAVEIEPFGKAIASLLGTTKAFKKTLGEGETTVFYSKSPLGKAERLAFIQKGIYEPGCTHTWAIGIDPKSGKVTQVRVIEMSCPHAFPTRTTSFLDQFTGIGPSDLARLDAKVIPVAKATGSSRLATDAVRKSIVAFSKYKGQIE